MTLCLDTNVLIDLINGRRPLVRERYYAALIAESAFMVSTVVLQELAFGALIRSSPEREREMMDAVLWRMTIVDYSAADAEETARVRADLEKRGQRIGAYDMLIAGHARCRGWTLVTANTREFDRVEGLSVQDWTIP